mgnify:CR=1 FL=1
MSNILVGARCNGCRETHMMSGDQRGPVQCPRCKQTFPAKDTGEVFFNCGNELAGKSDFTQAIDVYTTAIHYNPQDKEAYNNRGLCHGSLGNHAAAIRDYDEVLRIDPRYEDAAFNRGLAVRGERP